MSGSDFEAGLKRVSGKETTNQMQGRSGSKVPMTRLRGDKNPTKSGGINRATQSGARRG
jgi:hypothetical protein